MDIKDIMELATRVKQLEDENRELRERVSARRAWDCDSNKRLWIRLGTHSIEGMRIIQKAIKKGRSNPFGNDYKYRLITMGRGKRKGVNGAIDSRRYQGYLPLANSERVAVYLYVYPKVKGE